MSKALSKPPNYVLMHDVWVEDRHDDFNFSAFVKNEETAEWTRFVINSCHDFVPTKEIKRGATLLMLQYVEDRTGSCDELDGRYAGYTLLRDSHDKAIYSVFPGSPTAWSTAGTEGAKEATAGAQ